MATELTPAADRLLKTDGTDRRTEPATVGPVPTIAYDIAKLGRRSSLLACLLTLLFVALTVTLELLDLSATSGPDREWLQIWILVPVLLLAPVVVVAMVCLHASQPAARRVFSQLAVVFSGLYAAVIGTNYFIQFVVVLPRVATTEADGLSVMTMGAPASVFSALESAGYGFFALMALSAGAALAGTRSWRWLRRSLLTTGVAGVAGAAGAIAAQPVLVLAGFTASLAAFLVAALLLTTYFRGLVDDQPGPDAQGQPVLAGGT